MDTQTCNHHHDQARNHANTGAFTDTVSGMITSNEASFIKCEFQREMIVFYQTDIFAHGSGHLWHTLFGFEENSHFHPIPLEANLFVIAGFYIVLKGWEALHAVQEKSKLATNGTYSRVRHPQYDGFVLVVYIRLVKQEGIIVKKS